MSEQDKDKAVLREIPHEGPRVETGPTRIGSDWAGVFIRGDNAMNFAMSLESYLKRGKDDPFASTVIEGLVRLLRSCDENS